MDAIGVCFNIDGVATPGQKVGLLSKHYVWCYLIDSFGYEWRSIFKLEGVMHSHAVDMIDHICLQLQRYISHCAVILAEFEVSAISLQCFAPLSCFIKEIQCSHRICVFVITVAKEFYMHSGRWSTLWSSHLPDDNKMEVLEEKSKGFALDQLKE